MLSEHWEKIVENDNDYITD